MRHESEFRLAPDHPVFAGHFPGRPIVPGVMLLDAVYQLAARAAELDGPNWKINAIKFLNPLGPDEIARVHCDIDAVGTVRFEVVAGNRSIAAGSLSLQRLA